MRFSPDSERELIRILKDRGVGIEGNILKIIETDSPAFLAYVAEQKEEGRVAQKKRLQVNMDYQKQYKTLEEQAATNRTLSEDLQVALAEAQTAHEAAEKAKELAIQSRVEEETAKNTALTAKKDAEEELNAMQKKNHMELVEMIVRIALFTILGSGLITSTLYGIALWTGRDTTLVGNVWGNLLGITITNAFSIIGTIVGVQYSKSDKKETKDVRKNIDVPHDPGI